MYLQNKYTAWYYNIVRSAKNRNILGYFEKHHIIPKSLGGDNSDSNLVNLTPREHFICHKLLTKMVKGKFRSKMMHAYRALAIIKNPYRPPFKINSKEFEKLKTLGLRKGAITSTETKNKISNIKKIQNAGSGNPMYGKNHSIESRNKISITRKLRASNPSWNLRPPCSKEKAEKIKKANLGKNGHTTLCLKKGFILLRILLTN